MKITIPAQRIRTTRAAHRPWQALYWAYGSNLCVDHMSRRCPDSAPLAALEVSHMALVFRGVADVTTQRDRRVPGGLWYVTPGCERSLDSYEGVSSRVYLKRYFTARIDGEPCDVLFYQMQASRGVMPPSESYLRTIEMGYENFGLDKAYLNEALEESWEQKDVTPMLRERHIRRGRPKLAAAYSEFTLSEDDLREAGAT